LVSITYSSGIRRTSRNQNINLNNTNGFTGVGYAFIGQSELITKQITHTLTFDKKITSSMNLNAVVGYEYVKFTNKGSNEGVNGPPGGFGQYGLDYTNYIQYGDQTTRSISSYIDPLYELQSYFARVNLNYDDRFIVTGTVRADGSTKFGANNKYGYFPSFGVAWNVSRESFLKDAKLINSLKVRAGWGKTGQQDIPSGSSVERIQFSNNGALTGIINYANPDLKWQSDRQYNIGVDATILKNTLNITVDYFDKKTTDLLYPVVGDPNGPSGSTYKWQNLSGFVENKGVEATVNASIINKRDLGWDFGVNASFIHNEMSGLSAPIFTGGLHGQGITGTLVQTLQNGLPINAFWTRQFLGMDKNSGLAVYQDEGNTFYYVGNPNPTTVLGISTSLRYKKFNVSVNMNGAFGQDVYNNTLNNVINVGSINGGRNIALSVFKDPIKESFANPVTASSRFIEDGSYLKLSNATISYGIGNMGKVIKGANIYLTGQNLFVITKFSGFDPEVNVDKGSNFVPSVGIEYQPYPSARTITLGISFSL
jgi:hypothetical protein